jgi:hypothetical protein
MLFVEAEALVLAFIFQTAFEDQGVYPATSMKTI